MNRVQFTPYDSRLYSLLCEKMPKRFRYEVGETVVGLNINRLANEIGISGEGARKWLRSDRIPPKGGRKLIAVSDGALKAEDLLPFFI